MDFVVGVFGDVRLGHGNTNLHGHDAGVERWNGLSGLPANTNVHTVGVSRLHD